MICLIYLNSDLIVDTLTTHADGLSKQVMDMYGDEVKLQRQSHLFEGLGKYLLVLSQLVEQELQTLPPSPGTLATFRRPGWKPWCRPRIIAPSNTMSPTSEPLTKSSSSLVLVAYGRSIIEQAVQKLSSWLAIRNSLWTSSAGNWMLLLSQLSAGPEKKSREYRRRGIPVGHTYDV